MSIQSGFLGRSLYPGNAPITFSWVAREANRTTTRRPIELQPAKLVGKVFVLDYYHIHLYMILYALPLCIFNKSLSTLTSPDQTCPTPLQSQHPAPSLISLGTAAIPGGTVRGTVVIWPIRATHEGHCRASGLG